MNLKYLLNPKCVQLKCDPLSIGAAAIAGGSSLLGGLLNLGSTNSTNRTNMRIAQMNNEWSERMMDKQNAYNTDMWNKTNEYNSAVNQRKRLEEAGLNPYMMLNGGSAGSASSQTSAGINAPSTPNIVPQNFDFLGSLSDRVTSAMSSMADLENKNEITHGLRIENKYKAANLIADIWNKQENAKSVVEKTNYQKLINSVFSENNRIDNENKIASTEYTKTLKSKALAEAALTKQLTNKEIINNKYLDKRNLMELNEIGSRILLNKSSAHLNSAQAKAAVANAVLAYAQANKVNIDSKTADAISGYIVSSYNSDAVIKEEKSKNMYNYGTEEAPFEYGGHVDANFTIPGTNIGVNGGGNVRGYKSRH